MPFYYTVPDGHNPAGISFSTARREDILNIARELGVLIVEDAPYLYIDYNSERPTPFLSLDASQTVHLFTGSKIGLPGPRVGFIYTDAHLAIAGDSVVPMADLLLTESSSDILFQNPAALRGFEALLHERSPTSLSGAAPAPAFQLRNSLWDVAEEKLLVYRENRQILLDGLDEGLGAWPAEFHWTRPEAGFFSVFSFLQPGIVTDDAFTEAMVAEHGVVVIPMYDFYPADARERDPGAGLNQLRISFCFSESTGEQRRADMANAVAAFCAAVRSITGKPKPG